MADDIEQLEAALAATPENKILLVLVLRGYLQRDDANAAHRVLAGYPAQDLQDSEQKNLAAQVCLAVGQSEQALAYLHDANAPGLILKARALLALSRLDEAKRAYQEAISLNASLEQRDLAQRLAGNVREIHREDRPKLRVISNDDTDASELTRLMAPQAERISFADVGGLDALKKTIHKKIILPYQKPSLFQRFKKRVGGGILMYGPPGCGKTLLARATAGECKAEFFNIAISDVLDMYIGESEQKLHAVFEHARQSAPAVLFFDEVEALGGKRQYSREGTSSKLVSQFLTEMDGFAQNNHGVLILAATNVPWAIDPAFRRPGRFDRVLFVSPPDRAARASIISLLLQERPTQDDIDIDYIARHTSAFSGADLRELIETGVDNAIDESLESEREVPLRNAHLKQALKELRPSTQEWLTTARNYAKYANEGGQYNEVLAFLNKHGKS